MKNKLIIKGLVLVVIILFIGSGTLNIVAANKMEIGKPVDTPPLLPRLFMKIEIWGGMPGSIEITNITANKIFHRGNKTISVEHNDFTYDKSVYIGNVIIKGRVIWDAEGDVHSFFTHIITKVIHRFLSPYYYSLFPGFYEFEGNFTIRACYLVLFENKNYSGIPPNYIGYGLFVRIY